MVRKVQTPLSHNRNQNLNRKINHTANLTTMQTQDSSFIIFWCAFCEYHLSWRWSWA